MKNIGKQLKKNKNKSKKEELSYILYIFFYKMNYILELSLIDDVQCLCLKECVILFKIIKYQMMMNKFILYK